VTRLDRLREARRAEARHLDAGAAGILIAVVLLVAGAIGCLAWAAS
jgi:hypothetical protein